jgi:Na+/H+-dicarboxylate symporter
VPGRRRLAAAGTPLSGDAHAHPVDLPLEGVGLLLAIDPILDMMRTATNVAARRWCPVIVAKRNGLLDERIYKQRAGGLDRTRAHHRFLIMLLIMDTAET